MSKYKKIPVHLDTFERLQKLKISQGETMDYLLTRLLDKYEVLLDGE